MILPKYHITSSRIPGAGKGLFLAEPVARGRLITAPDAIPQVFRWSEIEAMPNAADLLPATVRWFEDRYTISADWPDECYINHAFEPTGLWHLGFVFAMQDLPADCEITVDYRHLLAPGQHEDFADALSGQAIVGWNWQDSLRNSTMQLLMLLG